MSAEKINTDLKKTDTNRVDINTLIARVRSEKQKETKVNSIFFVLFLSLILIVGILLAL
tara:strand:+ start:472 stop:648 length:177 start_codon:yes stop_codon:yes gene_type:complete